MATKEEKAAEKAMKQEGAGVVNTGALNAPEASTTGETPSKGGGSYTREEVQQMIAQAIKGLKEENEVKPAKRVTTHNAKMYRFDGKWVVDFKNQNVDEYVKKQVYAYNKWNEFKRENEAWIELVFLGGETKHVPLLAYVTNRIAVECPMLDKKAVDRSYSLGDVEIKKVNQYRMEGTGVMTDQTVEQYENYYTVQLPDGQKLEVPEYILA